MYLVFESGHRNGHCVGLGGTAKHQASETVKQGKACVQDATDFYSWVVENQKSINYRYYTLDEYEATFSRISQVIVKPIFCTMNVHVVLVAGGNMYIAETLYYSASCLNCEPSGLYRKWTYTT